MPRRRHSDRCVGHHDALDAAPLVGVSDWLHPFEHDWRQRLAALSDHLQEDPEP
jgi:hypothetical protein